MTLILSGTNGLSDVDGSAATPAVRGTDANTGIFFGTDIIGFAEGGAEVARFNADAQFVAAAGTASLPVITTTGDVNTGIFFPAADTIAFSEGGVESMRIDSSGNVGIGTTVNNVFDQAAAARALVVQKADASTTLNASTAAVVITNADTTTNNTSQLNFAAITGASTNQYTAGVISCIFGARTNGQYASGQLVFSTSSATNFAPTEKMRIDSSGNLLVGTTSAVGKFTVSGNAGASRVAAVMSNTASDAGSGALLVSKFDNTTTTSQVFVAFAVNNNTVASGQINANGASAAAFGSYSDSRLKQNIVDLPSQLANIMALRTVEFDYIESEGGGHQIGFIAQEVQQVYPDLVGERADGMLTLTDLNKNDARLIKCIQEQQALITALTARIEALENK
jgi:hypothetical protein